MTIAYNLKLCPVLEYILSGTTLSLPEHEIIDWIYLLHKNCTDPSIALPFKLKSKSWIAHKDFTGKDTPNDWASLPLFNIQCNRSKKCSCIMY